jgi:hypothetical protein
LKLFAIKLFSSGLFVGNIGDNVKLLDLLVQDPSEVNVILDNRILSLLLLYVPFLVFIQNHIFGLKSSFVSVVSIIQQFQCVR